MGRFDVAALAACGASALFASAGLTPLAWASAGVAFVASIGGALVRWR